MRYSLVPTVNHDVRLVVSFTSIPARIGRVWLVAEAMLRQTKKPDKLILWLSKDQFISLEALPAKLLKMQKRGLEIHLVDGDLRSHKKYYYAMHEYPNSQIITVDDDVFYNSLVVEHLVTTSSRFPDCVCANQALRIGYQKQNILPYLDWEETNEEYRPGADIFPVGIGGVLYPPKSLYVDVFSELIFMETCPMADDIWLNAMARLNGTLSVKTEYNSVYLPIIHYKKITLSSKNRSDGLNDRQLDNLRNYYIKNKHIDPFYPLLSKSQTVCEI